MVAGVPIAISVGLLGFASLMDGPPAPTPRERVVEPNSPVVEPEALAPEADVSPPAVSPGHRTQWRPVDAPASRALDPGEEMAPAAEARSVFIRTVAAVGEEPRDPAWAPAQERVLQEHYGALEASLPVRLSSVECRTESCVLSFDFENYADAQASVESIAHAAFKEPYGFDVMFPSPDDPDVPYTGRMLTNRVRADHDG